MAGLEEVMIYRGVLNAGRVRQVLEQLVQSGRSGKLTLTGPGRQATMLVSKGKVADTWTSWKRQLLGEVLLSRALVTRASLDRALDRQERSSGGHKLGFLLRATADVAEPDLTRALRIQVEELLEQVMTWHSGHYSFEPLEVHLQVGEAIPLGPILGTTEVDVTASGAQARWDDVGASRAGHLNAYFHLSRSLRTACDPQEVAWQLLPFALRFVDRAALFFCSADGLRGFASAGLGQAEEVAFDLGDLSIPTAPPSILNHALQAGRLVRQAPLGNDLEQSIFDRLGGDLPFETMAVPLFASGAAFLVLYGDVTLNGKIEHTDILEEGARLASLLLDRAELAERLEATENSLRREHGRYEGPAIGTMT